MADIAAQTPLFSFDQVRIDIQDLVRTGFQEKYNELAKAVITDITWRLDQEGTSGGQQIIEFHTSDLGVIEIPIFGGGGIIAGLCAEDICYVDESGNFDNVQDALDSLLNPYQSPTGTTTGAPGIKEIGDSRFYPITLTTIGTKKSKDLEYVQLKDPSNLGGATYTNNSISTGSNGTIAHTYSTSTSPAISPTTDITYTWTGTVKDIDTAAKSAGSDYLQYVYPYFKFNNASQQETKTELESLINFGSITSILDSHSTGPTSVTLAAATSSQFMHILVPAAYDNVSEIIDANLGLGSAPGWDTALAPSATAEFRRADVTLTRSAAANYPQWTNIPYRIYYSKIQKSNLTLIFNL